MSFKAQVKELLFSSGWYVKRVHNIPTGVNWALDLKRLLNKTPDGIFFDVGANVGQTARFMRREFPSAVIHAFEPVPDTFEILERNASAMDKLYIHKIALSDSDRVVDFSYVPNAEQRNSIENCRYDDDPSARRARATVMTIDNFCSANGIERITLIKTDTEGHDASVLSGARGLLFNARVGAVLTEVTFDRENRFNTQFSAVDELLYGAGFLLCSLYETETLQRSHTDGAYCNALFVKRDLLPSNLR